MALFGIQKILMCVILMKSLSANSSPSSETSPDSYFYAELPTQADTSACYNFSVGNPDKKEFFSPNYPYHYPSDTTCTLRLTAAPGQTITLDFRDRFVIEDSDGCKFDRLEVRDGGHDYSPLLGVFCGNLFPKRIVSTERYMWLRFTSDHNREYRGFKAIYDFKDMENEVTSAQTIPVIYSYSEPTHTESSACYNFSVIDPVKKQFFSPNYPNPYPNNITCTLRITAAPGQIIALDFRGSFNLENSEYCDFDRLEVRDGTHEFSPLLGVFCGDQNPKKIFSTGNYMRLRFTSDDSVGYDGFKAVYEFKDMENQDAGDIENGESTTGACYNFSVVDPVKKEFFSPNYPNDYPSSTTCILRLTAAPGQIITLDFLDRFDLEEDTSDCEYDSLEVRDGAHEYSPLLGVFCGNEIPMKMVSTERYMWLRFTSDDSDEYGGFKAVYNFKYMENQDTEDIETKEAETSPDSYFSTEPTQADTSACYNFSVGDPDKQEFFSPNYPNPYPNDTTCTLRLTAAPGQTITLDFRDRFDLEEDPYDCEYDRLEVRDGAYEHSPLLGEFCGHQFPKKVVSTGRYMWLRFMSDDSFEYNGFRAIYEFKDMENQDKMSIAVPATGNPSLQNKQHQLDVLKLLKYTHGL